MRTIWVRFMLQFLSYLGSCQKRHFYEGIIFMRRSAASLLIEDRVNYAVLTNRLC